MNYSLFHEKIISQVSSELKLVALLSLPNWNKIQQEEVEAALPVCNKQRVRELIQYHRVWSCASSNIGKVKNDIPGEFRAWLILKAHNEKLSAQKCLLHTTRITQLLQKHDIKSATIKGIPLAKALYSDIGARHSKDIDLLIAPGDLAMADNILEKHGYHSTCYHSLSPKQKCLYTEAHKDICYKYEDGVSIELHTRIFEYRSRLGDDFAKHALLKASTDTKYEPSELLVLYLTLHGSMSLFHRLKWLTDLAIIIANETAIDTEAIMVLARKYQIHRGWALSVYLSHILFGTHIPSSIEDYVARDPWMHRLIRLSIAQLNHPESAVSREFNLKKLAAHWIIQQGIVERRALLAHRLRPTVREVVNYPRLGRLVCIIRPFSLMMRLFKKGR
jgi:hypothetical protein